MHYLLRSRGAAPAFLAVSRCTINTRLQHRALFANICQQRSVLTASANNDSSFTTDRLQLDHIFAENSRQYLFTTRKNIRDYEWSIDEADQLFEDISSTDDSNILELNTITIIKATIDDKTQDKIGKSSEVYDVHDGQQRLITLSLLLAAIRDSLDSKGCKEVADEIARRICPTSARSTLKPVCRVNIRSNDAKILKIILSKKHVPSNEHLWIEEGTAVKDLLGKDSPLMPKKQWKKFRRYEQCMLGVYDNYLKRIRDLPKGEILELVDQFSSFVYVILCFPSSTKIARQIVMGQSRGKDTEPVDMFKGMVCFSKNDDDATSDQVFKEWNDCSDEVTRDVIEEACVLIAQGQRGEVLRRGGEVDIFESYLEDITRNEEMNGKQFFEAKVKPAGKILKQLYDGSIQLEKKDDSTAPSLHFLLSATSIATVKEVRIVVLHLLLQHAGDSTKQKFIEEQLKKLEAIALWCMLAKPRPKERFDRCMRIISEHEHNPTVFDLSQEEKDSILNILHSSDFGATGGGRRKVKMILERLNEYHLVSEHQSLMIEPASKSTLHIEHVLPQSYKDNSDWAELWPHSEVVSEWKDCLGNLALINQKKNSKISNHSFDVKKNDLSSSPYPLTKRISTYNLWNIDSVEKNHNENIQLARKVFNL